VKSVFFARKRSILSEGKFIFRRYGENIVQKLTTLRFWGRMIKFFSKNLFNEKGGIG